MTFSLLQHERIKTTLPKAKELRRFVEKMISLGKSGSLHDRRRAMALMGNKIIHHKDGKRTDVVGKLFSELAERYSKRNGGYTRIYRLAVERSGDAADMALIEFVDAPSLTTGKEKSTKKKSTKKSKKKKSDQTEEEAPSA